MLIGGQIQKDRTHGLCDATLWRRVPQRSG